MLSFVYGTKNSSKTEYMTEMIAKRLEQGKRVILLVPERRSVVTERRMISYLKNEGKSELEILSFRRLCNRVFREYGGLGTKTIGRAGKILILWRVLRELSPMLSVYNSLDLDNRKIIGTLLDTLTTLDRAALSNELLQAQAERAKKENNVALGDKLNDLVLIRAAYQTVLSKDFDDPEKDLERLCHTLDRNDFFCDFSVFIDETASFSGSELAVIRRILAQSPEVIVSLGRTPDDHRDVCRKLIWCEKALRREAEAVGCEVQTEAILPDTREGAPVLAFLRTHLFGKDEASSPLTEGISLYSCDSAQAEAEMIAASILDSVQNGARWRDHAVALREIDSYRGILDRRLQRAGIPFYYAQKRPLAHQSATRSLLAALDVIEKNYRLRDVCAYMKCGGTTLDFEQICRLEEYAKIWQIEGSRWYTDRPFCMNPKGRSITNDEHSQKRLQALNEAKLQLILPLEELALDQKGLLTVRQRVEALYRFYEKNGYPERIRQEAHQKNESGDSMGAMHLCQTNDLICECFDELWETVGDMTCSLSLFCEMLRASVEERTIGSIPQKSDEVLITDVFSLGNSHYENLYLPGLVDGVFPSASGGEGLFSNAELQFLALCGIDLPGMYEQRCADEFFAFEQAVGAAREHLTLSYPKNDKSANGTSPSLFLSSVTALLCNVRLQSWETLPLSKRLGSAEMIQNLYLSGKIQDDNGLFERVFANTLSPVSYGGGFSQDFVLSLYGNNLLLSQSKLEKFIECPFAYTCRYLFKLQSDVAQDTAANEYGTLMHAVFEQVLDELCQKGDPATADDQTLKEAVAKRISDFQAVILGQSEDVRTLHLLRRAGATAFLLLSGMRDEFRHSRFRPVFFELPFGLASEDGKLSLPPMQYLDENGLWAGLRGVADRVDLYKDGDTAYIRIVDYKTGNKEFDPNELQYGLSAQMLLYMRAVCTCQDPRFLAAIGANENTSIVPAGIVYCIAKRPKLMVKPDMSQEDILAAARLEIARHGIAIDEPDLLSALDNSPNQTYLPTGKGKRMAREEFDAMLQQLPQTLAAITKDLHSGTSAIKPLCEGKQDACRYCDFRAVCRYKEESKKEEST